MTTIHHKNEEEGRMYELLVYMADGGVVLGMPNKQKYESYANVIYRHKEYEPVTVKIHDGREVKTQLTGSFHHQYDKRTGETATPTITIHSSEKDKVIALAHELGHAIDLKHNYHLIRQADGRFTHEFDQENTLKKEQNAWAYSIDILNQVDFKEWDHFREVAERSCSSYVKTIVPEDQQKEMMNQFRKELDQRLEQVLEIEHKSKLPKLL